MCKLSILTATIGSILVLIPQLALPQFFPFVGIDADENSCTLMNANGELVYVNPPDKIKVTQRGGNLPQAKCEDATEILGLTTDGGPPIFYQGGGGQSVDRCVIHVGGSTTYATYKEKIDKRGTTLTCQGYYEEP